MAKSKRCRHPELEGRPANYCPHKSGYSLSHQIKDMIYLRRPRDKTRRQAVHFSDPWLHPMVLRFHKGLLGPWYNRSPCPACPRGLLGVRGGVVIKIGWLPSSPCSLELAAAEGFLGMESILCIGSSWYGSCTCSFDSESYSELWHPYSLFKMILVKLF